jgi:hypothetical protein
VRKTRVQLAGEIPELSYIKRIIEFLGTHEGYWCDSCITTSMVLGSPRRVSHVTSKLGMARRYYERAPHTECDGCGKLRKCISLIGSEDGQTAALTAKAFSQ